MKMGSAEKFCLRWNDFERNVSLAFREIREEKDFFDCTISCGSRKIEAHKLILSACSPFFRTVLKQNPHQHPLLYLKGVEFTDLQAVLNFMYHGEVNVAQEELNSFLAVAEDLQVKGLTQTQDTEAVPSSQPEKPDYHELPRHIKQPPTTNLSNPNQMSSKRSKSVGYSQDDDVQEISMPEIKKEPQAYIAPDPLRQQHVEISNTNQETNNIGMQVQMATTTMDESYIEEDYDYGQYDGIAGYQLQGVDPNQDVVEAFAEKLDSGKYSCKLCGFVTRDKYNIRWHLEGKHELGPGYECDICKQGLKTKKQLTQHRLQCVKNSSL